MRINLEIFYKAPTEPSSAISPPSFSNVFVDGSGSKGGGGRFGDSNVPYPRTSGASFAGNAHIICFAMITQYSHSTSLQSGGTGIGSGGASKASKDALFNS
jgi:hypothetical protein